MPNTALRRHREAKGLTQPDLARLVGCSQPSIVNYEKGRGFPRDPAVQAALRRIFKVPLPQLFAAEPEPGPGTTNAAQKGGAV